MVEHEFSVEITNSKAIKLAVKKSSGVGLQNIEKRLEMLYPENYKIEVKDHDVEYEVRLTLNIRNDD